MAIFVAHYAPRGSHWVVTHAIDRIVALCGIVPYAVVALILRIVAARAIFIFGQTKLAGQPMRLSLAGITGTVLVPNHIPDAAFKAAATQFASVSISPTLIATAFAYAEFVLPICLVIGFGTRIAAALLLLLTIALHIYVAPDALWTLHAYWAAMLLVLMTCGPGVLSLDWLVRHQYQRGVSVPAGEPAP
jgi:putative oxidoreductase